MSRSSTWAGTSNGFDNMLNGTDEAHHHFWKRGKWAIYILLAILATATLINNCNFFPESLPVLPPD